MDNHEKVYSKLVEWAENHSIKIINDYWSIRNGKAICSIYDDKTISLAVSCGMCNFGLRKVVILAHELGHIIQYLNKSFEEVCEVMDDDDYVGIEINAWNNAYGLLSDFGWNDWEYFKRVKEECLESYRELYG